MRDKYISLEEYSDQQNQPKNSQQNTTGKEEQQTPNNNISLINLDNIKNPDRLKRRKIILNNLNKNELITAVQEGIQKKLIEHVEKERERVRAIEETIATKEKYAQKN